MVGEGWRRNASRLEAVCPIRLRRARSAKCEVRSAKCCSALRKSLVASAIPASRCTSRGAFPPRRSARHNTQRAWPTTSLTVCFLKSVLGGMIKDCVNQPYQKLPALPTITRVLVEDSAILNFDKRLADISPAGTNEHGTSAGVRSFQPVGLGGESRGLSCKPSIAHIGWDYRPVVKRIVSWVKNLKMDKDDRRKSYSKANSASICIWLVQSLTALG